MAFRPFALFLVVVLLALGAGGILRAQMEPGDRGILPIDSSGTLEITGIHVDVGGKTAEEARYNGWRVAQREGFKALWAKTNKRPASEAPNLPDSTLDGMVSSIVVEREQIGPTRYIADLGIQFDRARAGALLGIAGEYRRSQPMLLIPVLVTGGTATTVELKNPWQRAWAYFRTSQSPIDYVRVSGIGIDPLLVNMAQTQRPGRGWWRNIVDFYGAADILVAEAQVQRLFPGGPARARFIARHGPDGEIVGGFTIKSRSGNMQQLMEEGVRQMDLVFAAALAAGRLERDPSLDIPEPPPLPEEEIVEEEQRPTAAADRAWTYQVQIVSPTLTVYNFAMAHLRTAGGVEQAVPVAINEGGVSYVNVTVRGDLSSLAATLRARGWAVEQTGFVLRMASSGNEPPPIPRPPPPAPAPAPAPAQPPATPAQPPPGNAQ